jgi:hypothetical protein
MLAALIAIHVLSPGQSGAPAILKRVRESYQRLASYQDLAHISTPFLGGSIENSFQTWFVRPNQWRVDYSEPQPGGKLAKVVLWQNRNSPKFWEGLSGDPPTAAPDIGIGFGSLAMVAGTYVKVIPSLLHPNALRDSALDEIARWTVLPPGKIALEGCHRIRGVDPSGSETELWVDTKRLLIRRMVSRHGGTVVTVNYTPIANPAIPPSTFDFQPPN